MHAAVKIHTNADISAHRIPYGSHVRQHRIDLGVAVDELQLLAGVHLHCAEAPLHRSARGVGGIRRAITANPGVHPDTLAHPTTEQVADRDTQCLALDVPQRLIDTGNGAHQNGAAPVEAATVHHRPEVFDVARIAPHQVVGQLIHCRGDAVRAAFDDRLAPAGDAFIGFDLEEEPAWRHNQRGKAGNFQRSSLACARRPTSSVGNPGE